MNLQIIWHLLKFIIIFVVPLHISGCASLGPTKPNLPYRGDSYPDELLELEQANPLLVKELGKLPEIQDGISETEMDALSSIVELYNNYPVSFEYTFGKMNGVGLLEYRKYCTPLQALFWLADDGKLDSSVIENYTLKDLLDIAWLNKESWRTLFSESDKEKIVAGVKGKVLRSQFEVYFRHFDEGTVNTIKYKIKYEPEMFTWSARRTIKNALKRQKESKGRWGDFSTVVDRLNAPVLVDAYLNMFITYKRVCTKTPERVFQTGFAQCISAGYFGDRCLKKAGYKTFKRHVVWGPWVSYYKPTEHAGMGIILQNGDYLLVVNFDNIGNKISGPYKHIEEVDFVIANYKKIVDRMWGFFSQPNNVCRYTWLLPLLFS